MNRLSLLLSLLLVIVLNFSCEEDALSNIKVKNIETTLNPKGYAPLTASVSFETNEGVFVQVRVIGKHGTDSDVVHNFPNAATSFELPILGLYPNYENEVELRFFDNIGNELGMERVKIETEALSVGLPQVQINTAQAASASKDWYFVNYFGFLENPFPQRPFLFDAFGDIRWYADYEGHPQLKDLFSDYGMKRLQNGNLIFGDRSRGRLYEIDMLGEVQNNWGLHGFGFHHTVIEKPNGNFLVTVNDYSKPTEEDVILEIDRTSGAIVNKWDLTRILDEKRRAWETNRADLNVDWFHANGLAYSEIDNSIIVSGRTQGVVKLTNANELLWILAPHKDWTSAANGTDLNNFLLQPLDGQGAPITATDVLDGSMDHPDFAWNWYQHSPILLPNGNLMLFDNGENRNYNNWGGYSRAVEFQIDETNRTVQQVWGYGKTRGAETFSPVTSNVWYHEDTGTVSFAPGSIFFENKGYGKIVEVDKASKQVIFEATITPPRSFYGITFHNIQRMPLYAEK